MRAVRAFLSLLVLLGVHCGGEEEAPPPVTSASATPESVSAATRFAGSFKHVGGTAELEARDKAIDDLVAEMSFMKRGVARDKLREANPIAEKIVVSESQGTLTISMDERSYTAPLDETPVRVKGITGDMLDLVVRAGPELEQVFSAEGKGRTNKYALAGDRLTIQVRIHSESLPRELSYALTYERI